MPKLCNVKQTRFIKAFWKPGIPGHPPKCEQTFSRANKLLGIDWEDINQLNKLKTVGDPAKFIFKEMNYTIKVGAFTEILHFNNLSAVEWDFQEMLFSFYKKLYKTQTHSVTHLVTSYLA